MRQLLPFGRFLAVYRILQPEDNTVLRSGTIMQRTFQPSHDIILLVYAALILESLSTAA